MRRTLTAVLFASLALAACGSDASSGNGGSTPAGGSAEGGPGTTFEDAGPPPTNPDKPTVQIPSEIPTELVVTVLEPGEGPEAAEGDTVIVDYIGVRSSDGEVFDNSYDRYEPFPVVLGSGSVIPGWDQGLIGAQAGSQIQLDIPSDLAYGEDERGDVIGPNEALTFVVDIRSVIAAAQPTDAPTEAGVDASVGATEVSTEDLIVGEGPEIEEGQTAVVHLVLFRGDNLVALDSTWEQEPIQVQLVDGVTPPGLIEGMAGMKVGGRRAIILPPDELFGTTEGNPEIGLPADTDVILVVDALGAY